MYWPEVDEKDLEEDDALPAPEVIEHGVGVCPVIWYQNTRDSKCPEGRPDCDGAWELLDKVDRLQSQATRATMDNVDPTLLIKEDERFRRRSHTLRKGKAFTVSEKGDARYLEMQGTSVKVAMEARP